MSIYLKTDYQCNDDDFVQNGDFLNELTVTITLCEYRNLIREQAQNEKRIEILEEELKKTRESAKTFMQLFMFKSPETINKICDLVNGIFQNETQEGESNEQIRKQESID